VVRVTGPKVLDRYAAEVWRARSECIEPDGLAPLAYAAACAEGQEITNGPAG
jgi:hypothetical protein